MYQQPVRIYQFGGTAHGCKIKTAFAFFDKIFHLSSAAIKLEYLIGFHFHSCDNKGIQVDHLSIRLFNFKYDSARMAPGSGLIQEFAVFYSVIHLIVLCCTVQSLVFLFG